MSKVLSVALSSWLLLSTQAMAAATEMPIFRDAQIVKSESIEDTYLEVPLAKIYRSGRGWEPEKVELVDGISYQTLYKIGRNVPLNAVKDFYHNAVLSLAGNQVLFECESRDCGSSNAWANNFFSNYLLYGGDANQSLLVTQDENHHYWLLYINRRGTGDIMVRLDEIIPAGSAANIDVIVQLSATDIPRIRRAINDMQNLESVVAFVTSKDAELDAITQGDIYIDAIREGLNPNERDIIRFINLANMGDPAYGSDRVIFVRKAQ